MNSAMVEVQPGIADQTTTSQPTAPPGAATLVDQVMPAYEFREARSIVIRAPGERIWQTFAELTFADLPLANLLTRIRYLGQKVETPKPEPFVKLATSPNSPWVLLAEEPGREWVIGLVGILHRRRQTYAPIEDPAEFARFRHPDYEKTVMSVRLAGGDAATGYTLTAESRTHAAHPSTRKKFAVYWVPIKVGCALMFREMLRVIKRRAEASAVDDLSAEDAHAVPARPSDRRWLAVLRQLRPVRSIETMSSSTQPDPAERSALLRLFYRGWRPTRFGRWVNRLQGWWSGLGLPPSFMAALEVRGRASGRRRSTPVVITTMAGQRYLVSMLGPRSDWVKNVDAAQGDAVLRQGRRRRVHLVLVAPDQRAPILREYVRLAPSGRQHFPLPVGAPLSDFEAIAERYPVYRIDPG